MSESRYEASRTGLLLVDPYNDFLSDGGKIWPMVKEVANQVGLLEHLRSVVAGASIGAPEKDRFQIIAEHEADSFQFDPEYLGIHRSADLVMIQITWNEGRTTAQKQALYKTITDGLHATVGLRREDVLINLVEVKKENWSYGNGIAQYVV